jgi:co-chaperonin GroES (HSP10)
MAKSESSQTRKYAAIGIGLGLAVGLTIAVFFLHPGAQSGLNDMGEVKSIEFGLKGHLYTEWKNERLSYHLTVEPATPAQRAGFLADVNSSPRPLSIILQAKDPFGAVLCGDTILVKFEPRNAPANAQQRPLPKSSRAAEEVATRSEITRGINLARLEGEELDREHGKNVFQSNIGNDGQVASILAQGVLPCTKKQVGQFASWGFISDFPVLVKPGVGANAAGGSNGDATAANSGEEQAKSQAAEIAAAAAKARKKPTSLPPIYIEGDDSIVWFDQAGGIIETKAGETMLLDKTDTVASAMKGHELPIPIHYRCDQSGGCTFSALGLGVHHARLKR